MEKALRALRTITDVMEMVYDVLAPNSKYPILSTFSTCSGNISGENHYREKKLNMEKEHVEHECDSSLFGLKEAPCVILIAM